MADWAGASATLNRIMPFLANEKAQRQQVADWLARNLQQIQAQEEANRRNAAAAARDRIAETLATNYLGAVKDIPGSQNFMGAGLMENLSPEYTGGIVVPPDAAAKAEAVKKALVGAYGQYQGGQPLDQSVLNALVTQVPEKIPLELVTGGAKNRLETSQQGLTAAGQKLTEKGQGLEARRIAVEEGKLKLEQNKPAGGKDAAAMMKEADNDIDAAIQKYAGVGQLWASTPEAQKALNAIIKSANVKRGAAAVSIGLESPIKTPAEMQMAGVAILNRFVQTHEIPNWYVLIKQGYDPDFVWGLHDALEKPSKVVKDPNSDAVAKAMAMLQQMLGTGEIKQ
jgi:hypothetical protein